MTSREVDASRSTRRTRAPRHPVRPLSPFIRALRPGHFFGPTDGTSHACRCLQRTRNTPATWCRSLAALSHLTVDFYCLSSFCLDSFSTNCQTSLDARRGGAAVGRSVGRRTSGSFGSTERHMGLNVPHRGTVAAARARRPGFWPSWRGGSWGRRHSTTETRGDQFITAQRVVNKPVPFFPLLAHFVTIYDLRASRAAGSCRRRIWRLIA